MCAFGARAALAGGGDEDEDEVDQPPLTAVEARVGYGVAFGGGVAGSVERWSPLTFTALVDHAVVAEPWTSMLAGVVVEGHGRGSAGALLAGRVRPSRGRLRIAGGGVAMLIPATLFGPLASVGGCLGVVGVMHLCADLEATLFVAGSDLPDERIAGQTQLVLGVAFDAW